MDPVKRSKKSVAFPFHVSYKVSASEDVPLAGIKVCIYSDKHQGIKTGPRLYVRDLFRRPGALCEGMQTQNKELFKWQKEQ